MRPDAAKESFGGGTGICGSPLIGEDSPDGGVPPALFHPGAISEEPFLTHAEAFAEAIGSAVFGDAFGVDAVQADGGESEADDGAAGFDGVALVPIAGIQFAAEFAFAVVGGGGADAAASNESAAGLEGDGDLEARSGAFVLPGDEAFDEGFDAEAASRLPGVVAQVVLRGLIREHGFDVIEDEVAQFESLSTDPHWKAIHPASTGAIAFLRHPRQGPV